MAICTFVIHLFDGNFYFAVTVDLTFLLSFCHFLIGDKWKWGRGGNKQKERQIEQTPVKLMLNRGMSVGWTAVPVSLSVGRHHCIPTLPCGPVIWGGGVRQCWRRMKSTFSLEIITKCCQTDSWCFFSLQAHLSFMRYISVCCVVGIIAGFCIGPGKLIYSHTYSALVRIYRYC